ncbi:MAG: metallophosphoesterase [Caldilineaceae bacterium]|nr:metallophosphoesterase [Caldilineaceae bacterium]
MENTKSPLLSRRRFLQFFGGSALSVTGLFGYVRVMEPNWIDVERITLTIPGLPERLSGLRIAQLSDIHLSKYTSAEKVFSAVRWINQLAPDFVMLTGDFVGNRAEDAAGLIDPLRALHMPAYAVYGNHDLWTDRATVRRFLLEGGVTILTNESTEVADGLYLAGLDDLWSGHPDLKVALREIPDNAATLLMIHEPDYIDRVVTAEAPVAIQFSGHTHGGQVRIPLWDGERMRIGAPILPRHGERYPIGLQPVSYSAVYTNRGLGLWPLPYRFNCRPEISLFTLQPPV